MTDAELQGKTREKLAAGAPKSPIPIDNNAFEGIADFVCKGSEHSFPGLRGFFGGKASQRDILGSGVGTEQERMMLAFNVDRFAVEQQIAIPGRLKFLGDLPEALAGFSQAIDPLKDPVGTDMEFSAHSTVGGLPIEVEMSGAQDEVIEDLISTLAKSSLARLAPPTPNLARPQPLGRSNLESVETIPLCGQGMTVGATFFSSWSPSTM